MWNKTPKTLFFHTDSYALVHINNNQWSKHKYIPFMVRELGPICFQPNILFQFRHLDTRENMWLLVSCATIPSTGSWDGQVTKRDSLSLGITSLEPVFRNLLCQYWHDLLLKHINGHGLFIESLLKSSIVSEYLGFVYLLSIFGFAASSIVLFISSIAYIHRINNLPGSICSLD